MPDIEDMLGKIFFLLWDGREIREMYRYMYFWQPANCQ